MISWLAELTHTALVNREEELPSLSDLDDLTEGNASARKVWVPNRNGVFLNIAASYAESLNAQYVVPGFNKEEAATFPDNSQEFINACDRAFSLSTFNKVKVKCFTTDLDKLAMAQKAREFDIDFKKLWSCYKDGEEPCNTCESCQRTLRALDVMGI
jgi:7-cyano-7-deazaguanine synthase